MIGGLKKINMTQEDKELLIKDLSARLPYYVKAKDKGGAVITICAYHPYGIIDNYGVMHNIGNTKPYLFPMSSMTEEQKEEYHYIVNYISPDDTENWAEGEFVYVNQIEQLLHFYHTNHLDYRGLIPMDLAIDATVLNIY